LFLGQEEKGFDFNPFPVQPAFSAHQSGFTIRKLPLAGCIFFIDIELSLKLVVLFIQITALLENGLIRE
jgi:hypothetical protein